MTAEQPGVAVTADQRARVRILGRHDRLHGKRACLVELDPVEARTLQGVGDQFQHQVDVAGQEARIDGEAFRAGSGRHGPADVFDRLRELRSITRAGPLLDQVREERCRALLAGLVAKRATADGDAH